MGKLFSLCAGLVNVTQAEEAYGDSVNTDIVAGIVASTIKCLTLVYTGNKHKQCTQTHEKRQALLTSNTFKLSLLGMLVVLLALCLYT